MNKKALVLLPVLGLAAAGLFIALRPQPVPPPRVLHPTPRQTALAAQHLEVLKEQVKALAAPTPPIQGQTPDKPLPRRRTLRISEDDLNIYLAGSRSARKLLAARGVQAVQVTLHEPSNLTLNAAVLVHGNPENVQIDGALASDPRLGLRFTATHAQMGRFPLPAAIVTKQANTLARRFAGQISARLPFSIVSVHVQGRQLVLTAVPAAAIPITRRAAALPQ